MSEVGKKLRTVLEGYAKFLRDRDLAPLPKAPITPGSMGPGVFSAVAPRTFERKF